MDQRESDLAARRVLASPANVVDRAWLDRASIGDRQQCEDTRFVGVDPERGPGLGDR
jgi:hypothetical protein